MGAFPARAVADMAGMAKSPKTTRTAGAVIDRRTRERLELEVISSPARLRLTRLLRAGVRTTAAVTTAIRSS